MIIINERKLINIKSQKEMLSYLKEKSNNKYIIDRCAKSYNCETLYFYYFFYIDNKKCSYIFYYWDIKFEFDGITNIRVNHINMFNHS